MSLLDFLTLLSFIGLNIDVLLQAHKVREVKSAVDISVSGLLVRFVAIFVILYKLLCIGDLALIIGQGLLAITFTSYMVLVLSYLPKSKKRKPRKR